MHDFSQKKRKKEKKIYHANYQKKKERKRKNNKLDKSRNLLKFVSVLLSASVERVGVSRMRDFLLVAMTKGYQLDILVEY